MQIHSSIGATGPSRTYRILADDTAMGPALELGDVVPELPAGELVEDLPGTYRILADGTAMGPTLELGDVVQELPAGELVEVVEVAATADLRRMRGRLLSPPGWISIRSLEPGDTRRWAVRLADPGAAGQQRQQQQASSSSSPAAAAQDWRGSSFFRTCSPR